MHIESSRLNGNILRLSKEELWKVIWINHPDKSRSTSSKCRSLFEQIDLNPDNEYPLLYTQHQWILDRIQSLIHPKHPDVMINDFKVVK
jgi:hypothetical protein